MRLLPLHLQLTGTHIFKYSVKIMIIFEFDRRSFRWRRGSLESALPAMQSVCVTSVMHIFDAMARHADRMAQIPLETEPHKELLFQH